MISAQRGEGKSFIAANLAVLFAQLGQRTLLIDADLVHPRQHTLFKVDNRIGLSSALCGLVGLKVAVPIPRLGGLAVLTAGPTPPNPRELLSRPLLTNLLAQAGQDFDAVLIDTPSGALIDAQIIAANAGASVLVSRPKAATVAETAALTAALGNLLGAVVNQF
jgi:receptor protein-tyrosine kinase